MRNRIALHSLARLALTCFLFSKIAAADACVSATETVHRYITLIAALSEGGFSNETQLKSLKSLTAGRGKPNNLGYFVYSSQKIESCSIEKDGQARVIVRYRVVGHVSRNLNSPEKPSEFKKVTEEKVITLRVASGKIQEPASDPFYPPVVAIQDYEERIASRKTAAESETDRDTLIFLKEQQRTYLQTR
jgi:hypothetical protein